MFDFMAKSEFSSEKSAKSLKKIAKFIIFFFFSAFVAFFCTVFVRAIQFKNCEKAQILSSAQIQEFYETLQKNYPQNFQILKPLPYNISNPELDIWAKSAIIIDTANGSILFEKNADEIIPPASMTKLFAMFVVEEEVAAGNLSYDQKIDLPPQTWACNMPPHSSLMFLGENQIVTLEELLLGLSICSGNDAAYALAYAVCGNMEDFVARMNRIASDLGLKNTRFEESSGYSEKNLTTAREMATFCRIYIEKFPDSLKKFHTAPSFTYPKRQNLAPGDVVEAQDFSQGIPKRITMPITQQNTNPLLGILDGADGLKTGYIDESGYNLSLTARRDGVRFLSVTMGGPGNSSREGQNGRIHDGTELMEWAFSSFCDFSLKNYNRYYFAKIFGAKQKGVNLIPATNDEFLTIPYVFGNSMEENNENIKIFLSINDLFGGVRCGEPCGNLKFYLGDYLLQEIPLVSDRTVEKSNFFVSLADKIVFSFEKNLKKS